MSDEEYYRPFLDTLGYSQLKEKQREMLNYIRGGGMQVVGILPTGYGKSAIYEMLPFVLKGLCIVFSPLSAIMGEQVQKLSASDVKSCILDTKGRVLTGIDCDESEGEILDIQSSMPLSDIRLCDLIFCHPEAMFATSEGQQLLESDRSAVKAVVIDECHKVHDWGESFRKAFACLKDLPAYFPHVPRLALSATVTITQEKDILQSIGMMSAKIVKENPDRINIFLEKILKSPCEDMYDCYENIYKPLCNDLFKLGSKFPVTLLYMPLQYIGNASAYCNYIFKGCTLDASLYACICSGQDEIVKKTVLTELSKSCPRFRLVLCTSVIGMGFNSPSITRIIHAKPPRNLPDYVQEIGRAGRSGQPAKAILYFNNHDIASNVQGITSDIIDYCKEEHCLRNNLLKHFGFKADVRDHIHLCCSYCKTLCTCFECEIFRIEI